MVNVNELPNDPALLKRLLIERNTMLAERNTMIDRIKQEAAEQIERLEAQHLAAFKALLRRYYGPRCEKFDPRQLLLFGLKVDGMPLDKSSIED